MTLKSTSLALWWEPGQDGELFYTVSLSLWDFYHSSREWLSIMFQAVDMCIQEAGRQHLVKTGQTFTVGMYVYLQVPMNH